MPNWDGNKKMIRDIIFDVSLKSSLRHRANVHRKNKLDTTRYYRIFFLERIPPYLSF